MIQERLFAHVFAALHIVADARHFSHSTFAARFAELHAFAAKNAQTVENDRRKVGKLTDLACVGHFWTDWTHRRKV